MTVCIIVPAYNAEKYIIECLDSIVAQTMQPNEVIVVDDGSTDNTAIIVKEYTEKYRYFKYIYQENQGQGKARNMALKLTETTHVMFLDSDDYLHNQTIARCAKWVAEENPDLVHFEHRRLYESGAITYPKENRFFEGISVAYEEMCENILNNSAYYTWNNLFLRSFLIDNDISYGTGVSVQDYIFLAKVGIYAKKICFIHAPLYTHRIHKASTSHRHCNSRVQFESFILGTLECLRAANEISASERASAYLINHKIRAYIHIYYEKTPKKHRKEFLARLYECFVPYDFHHLQHLNKDAKRFIGNGSALTRKKYLNLVLQTYFYGFRRKMKMFPSFKKFYRIIRGSLHGRKASLSDLKAWFKGMIVSRLEKLHNSQPVLDQTMAIIGFNGLWKGNGRYLYPMLQNNFPDWRIVYLHAKDALVPNDVETMRINSLRGRSLVFRSKVLFVESWERLPDRDDQLVIQLWHGTPIKKMLFDITEPYFMKDSLSHRSTQYKQIRKWDYFICDSQKAKDYFRSCFLLDDNKMLASGYPRVKYLLDNLSNARLKSEIRTAIDVKKSEILITYIPAWGDYALDSSVIDKPYLLNPSILIEHLNKNALYKLHSLEHQHTSSLQTESCYEYDTQDFILASDWVVSGFSSEIFDAIAIDTPVALLIKNRKEYEEARGLYQDIVEDFFFCTAESETELAEILNKPPDNEKYRFIRDKYCQLPNEFSLINDLTRILKEKS